MKGYSDRAFQEAFLTSMKNRIMSNFKKMCIGFGIVYLLIALLLLFFTKTQENGFGFYALTMLSIFIVLAITLLLYGIKAIRQCRKLEYPYVDGTVTKNAKTRGISTGRYRRRTRYTIVIEPTIGNKIKVKNEVARPYYGILEVGDEVRFHPGFVYPIELSDKSEKNICAFCGKVTDTDVCTRCGNPMLI